MPADINFVVFEWQKWGATLANPPADTSALAEKIVSNEDVWIVLTYLHLRRRRVEASISGRPVKGKINIVDGITLGNGVPTADLFCAGCRGDGHYPAGCQVIIQQNLIRFADQPSIYVPQWAQPGIIPRSPNRNGITNIGFLGHSFVNLSKAYRERQFRAQLRERGCELIVRDRADDRLRWHDYSDLDLILSVRNIPLDHLRLKPVNKLTNAWMAGVPAMIGPEPAIEAIQIDPLDYIRIDQPPDVLSAIDRLRANPELYESMVRHGRMRAQSFNDESVAQRWLAALEEVQAAYERWSRLSMAGRWDDYLKRVARLREHLETHTRQIHMGYEKLGYGNRWWEGSEPSEA